MKSSMLKIYKQLPQTIALTIACTLLSVISLAQNVVSGKVTNFKTGLPLQGVTVTVKGTKVSSQSGTDGTYRITVPANSKILSLE